MPTRPAIPWRTIGWSSTARIRICEMAVLMSSDFMPSPCVKTTNVFVLSRRRCWQERAVPLRYLHRLRSTLLAYLREDRRVPASRVTHSVPHWLAWRESPDQRLFHRPARVVEIAHCHNGFQPRSAVPERGETRSAALRQQFCRSHLGGWDADFAPRPRRRHGMQHGDWLSQFRVLAPKCLWLARDHCPGQWSPAVPAPHPELR